MTSEDIIQRLLDEKKITVKEAMVILKDLAKIGLNEVRKKVLPDVDDWFPKHPEKPNRSPLDTITVMYGINTTDGPWYNTTDTISYNKSISSLKDLLDDETGKSDE